MNAGDVFKNREAGQYPSVADIVAREVPAAHEAFPNAGGDDLAALALSASALRKNLAERTGERDFYAAAFRGAMRELHSDKRIRIDWSGGDGISGREMCRIFDAADMARKE